MGTKDDEEPSEGHQEASPLTMWATLVHINGGSANKFHGFESHVTMPSFAYLVFTLTCPIRVSCRSHIKEKSHICKGETL